MSCYRWMDDRNHNIMTQGASMTEEKRELLSQSYDQSSSSTPRLQTLRTTVSQQNTTSSAGSSRSSGRILASDYNYSRPSASSARDRVDQPQDDQFLSKLTEKLALHIREEVQKEMQSRVSGSRAKDVVAERMDSYLQVRLFNPANRTV